MLNSKNLFPSWILSFYARQHICYSAYMPNHVRLWRVEPQSTATQPGVDVIQAGRWPQPPHRWLEYWDRAGSRQHTGAGWRHVAPPSDVTQPCRERTVAVLTPSPVARRRGLAAEPTTAQRTRFAVSGQTNSIGSTEAQCPPGRSWSTTSQAVCRGLCSRKPLRGRSDWVGWHADCPQPSKHLTSCRATPSQ